MQSSFLVFRSYLENSNQITDFLCSNSHIDLINDESVKEKYKSYLDVDIIPDMYKTGRPYYENYNKNEIYPKLEDTNSVKKNKKITDKLFLLFNTNISPGLADLSSLKGLPKTLILVCECDMFKDEDLIYAERLKMAGVDVTTEYYHNGFHGSLAFIEKIPNDIISYLNVNY